MEDQIARLQHQVIRRQALRPLVADALQLRPVYMRYDVGDDLRCDVVLGVEQRTVMDVVGSPPEHGGACRFGQFDVQAQPGIGMPHRARDDVVHTECMSDLPQVEWLIAECQGRIAGHHDGFAQRRQHAYDVFDQASAEVVRLWIGADCPEGQHGNPGGALGHLREQPVVAVPRGVLRRGSRGASAEANLFYKCSRLAGRCDPEFPAQHVHARLVLPHGVGAPPRVGVGGHQSPVQVLPHRLQPQHAFGQRDGLGGLPGLDMEIRQSAEQIQHRRGDLFAHARKPVVEVCRDRWKARQQIVRVSRRRGQLRSVVQIRKAPKGRNIGFHHVRHETQAALAGVDHRPACVMQLPAEDK